MKLYGKTISKAELLKCTGNMSQFADARECKLTSGKADGVRAIEVKTGGGLQFTVLPSRALDIAWCDYKGTPISFISKSGVTHPAYFEKDGLGFFRGFYCGLLTTCGLTYMGAPNTDQGQELGLHGRISNIPAYDVAVQKEWEGEDYVIRIKGKVRESGMFMENICMSREIVTKLGSNILEVHDRIENCGFESQPHMLLYHCNFGYPLVSDRTKLATPGTKVTPRDAEAEKGITNYDTFESPQHRYNEQVFYHDLTGNKDGATYACLYNKELNIGAYVKFNKKQFAYCGEWKSMCEGDYVVGLEPATWLPEGRAKARELGQLDYIEPGEVKAYDFSIGIVESMKEVEALV